MFSEQMNERKDRYFILNKPYNMVSQFVSPDDVRLLGEINFEFPEGTHAIGRLDQNSEGLLILTTNKKVTKLLFQGEIPHKRTYLVQVVYKMSDVDVQKLREGVIIKIAGDVDWQTSPCQAQIVQKPDNLFTYENELPEFVAHSWITLTLTEGKFHQVRKMVNALNYKCKRLIRIAIEDMTLGNLQPGEVKEYDEETFFRLLKITNWRH